MIVKGGVGKTNHGLSWQCWACDRYYIFFYFLGTLVTVSTRLFRLYVLDQQ